MEQLFPLAFHQLCHRNARPTGHDAGDLALGDLVSQQGAVLLGLFCDALLLLQLTLQLGQAAVFQLGGFIQIVLGLGLFQLGRNLLDVLPQLAHLFNGRLFVLPPGLHGLEVLPQVGQFLLNIFQMLLCQPVGLLFQGGLLDFQLHDLAVDLVQLGGHGVHLGANHGAGLVHQIDGLVGQKPVADIAVGQGGRGDEGLILDLHAVVDLVPLLQAAEDGNAVLHGRLTDHHRLESPLQCGVLFDIQPVLVEGGGTDAVQLAPGQHGLEQVAGVHAALGLAGAHDGVQLVDEQDDPALAVLDGGQHRLEPLFKLSPELGTGNQCAHIQREDLAVFQVFGHVAPDDALGKALGDGRLAHTGLADKHRVVFGLAGQDADDVADLAVPADDRIQLLLPCPLHQIGAIFLQHVIGFLRVVGGDPRVAPHLLEGGQKPLLGDVKGLEQLLEGRFLLLQQAEEQMLHRNEVIFHATGLLFSGVEGLIQSLRDINFVGLPTAARDLWQRAHHAGNGAGKTIGGNAHAAQKLTGKAVALLQQGQQQMALSHLLVAVLHGQTLCALDGLQRFLGKLIEIHVFYKPPIAQNYFIQKPPLCKGRWLPQAAGGIVLFPSD